MLSQSIVLSGMHARLMEREVALHRGILDRAAKRAELKRIIASPNSSDEERIAAQEKLKKQPRDASASRLRRRCALSGRPRGF